MIFCDKIKLQVFNYISFRILFLIFSLGCSVSQPLKIKPETSSQEFRGLVTPVEAWSRLSSDSTKIQILDLVGAMKQAHFNTLVLDLNKTGKSNTPMRSEIPEEGIENNAVNFDPVLWAIREAHRQDLKIFVSLDLLGPGQIEGLLNKKFSPYRSIQHIPTPDMSWYLKNNRAVFLNPSIPETKTHLKKIIRDLVMQYDVDGLLLDFTKFSDFPEEFSLSNENSPLTGLVEDIMVEAMLVKPYLINAASFQIQAMDDHPEIIHWMSKGIVDLLIPVLKNTPNFAQPETITRLIQLKDEAQHAGCIFPGIMATGEDQPLQKISNILKENGIHGTVFYPGEHGHKILEDLSNPVYCYMQHEDFPADLKRIQPEQVFTFDVSELLGERKEGETLEIIAGGITKKTDSEGKIGFILGEKPDTLQIRAAGSAILLPTNFWKTPYDYAITHDGKVCRKMPWLEFREIPDKITHDPEFFLLGKTSWPAKAWINDDTVKVYKTGIFFHKVSLTEGMNRIRAGVITNDSTNATYTREITYVKKDKVRSPFPLWIDEKSITPDMNLVLTPEDRVHIHFRGSKGQVGLIRIRPGNREISCTRTDFEDYSLYEAEFSTLEWKRFTLHTFLILLRATGEKKGIPTLKIKKGSTLTVMEPSEFPWVRIIQDHTRLTYNLGPVRLGGPIRAEYPKGIVMKTSGIIGNFYRIHLNDEEEGYVEMENVELMPIGYSQTPYYITSLSCSPADAGDILSIPYDNSIPYAVYPEPAKRRIRIRLYGAMTSSTWVTHHKGRKYIDQVTWNQITPETYEVQVNLSTSRIWGYDLHPVGNRLIFRVKYPPTYDLADEKPLKGLKIAIEAGHGGESYGAMGLSGLLEKNINLDLAHRFGDLCRSFGAEILQVRETDTTMSLIDKRDKVLYSEADLLISVHANAAGTSRGYLGIGGTSTYYHDPFWAELAERMYDHLLELDILGFGVIGSFNYTVIRVSQMPSILVEQAFMTQAEDEEKLANPDFRQAMAQKMYGGILDYLLYMKIE